MNGIRAMAMAPRRTSGKSGQENAALETTDRSAAGFYEHKNG
jgi:hypothetical protein